MYRLYGHSGIRVHTNDLHVFQVTYYDLQVCPYSVQVMQSNVQTMLTSLFFRQPD
jgi:hypothetical protein